MARSSKRRSAAPGTYQPPDTYRLSSPYQPQVLNVLEDVSVTVSENVSEDRFVDAQSETVEVFAPIAEPPEDGIGVREIEANAREIGIDAERRSGTAHPVELPPPGMQLPPDESDRSNRPTTNRPPQPQPQRRPPAEQPQIRPPVTQPQPQPRPPSEPQTPTSRPPSLPAPSGETPGRGNCYIRNSTTSANQLQSFILMELEFRLSLQALARRNSRFAAELNSMAAETLQRARQLSAVHFFITGNRFWPQNVERSRPNRDFVGEAHRLHNRALEIDEFYRNASRRTPDRCLAALYNSLGDTKLTQAAELQRIMRRA